MTALFGVSIRTIVWDRIASWWTITSAIRRESATKRFRLNDAATNLRSAASKGCIILGRRLGMKRVLWTMLALPLAACLSFATTNPSNNIYGDYVEARTADVYTGPCFANSEVGLTGELAVFGWKVNRGEWHGTSLDGLSVVAAVKARTTLGDVYESAYPVRAVLIVDSRANP